MLCSGNLPLCPCIQGSSPALYSMRISVSGFMWRSLIHLDLSFVQGNKNGSIFILLHADEIHLGGEQNNHGRKEEGENCVEERREDREGGGGQDQG